MRAHKSAYVYENCRRGKNHRKPAVTRHIYRLAKIRRYFDYLFQYAPYEIERNKCQKCACRREDSRKIGQDPALSGVAEKPLQI